VLSGITLLGVERVSIADSLGRVLAETIGSPIDHPAFDNSAMDGYAVRWCDVQGTTPDTPVILAVSQEIPAGSVPAPLEPGTAARVMTGGMIPAGADTVVTREDTVERGDTVGIVALPDRGEGAHVRKRGENIARDSAVMAPGRLIKAGEIGLMAVFGRCFVLVRRRPVVAIVSTGDELVEIDHVPGPGQITNSSSHMLAALVAEAGGVPTVLPIASDTLESTRETFQMAMAAADIVLSIGGVSVGDYDVVKVVMDELCGELDFWRVRMSPGKPLAFGVTADGVPLIGLPGNPVSTFVSFYQFVRPAIRRAQGLADLGLPTVRARLDAPVRSSPTRLDFVRGQVTFAADAVTFTPYPQQGSGNPMSIAGVNALARIPIDVAAMKAGDTVTVELLP
jgi:molybdopterin molybdotransferase